MHFFSYKSKRELEGCHHDIKLLAHRVLEKYDHSISEGHRGKKRQNELKLGGLTKLSFPESKHNKIPSLAFDAVPYPVDWKNIKRFYHFAGYVLATAESMGIEIRWGGDWNRNYDLDDQSFMDLVHFELVL